MLSITPACLILLFIDWFQRTTLLQRYYKIFNCEACCLLFFTKRFVIVCNNNYDKIQGFAFVLDSLGLLWIQNDDFSFNNGMPFQEKYVYLHRN